MTKPPINRIKRLPLRRIPAPAPVKKITKLERLRIEKEKEKMLQDAAAIYPDALYLTNDALTVIYKGITRKINGNLLTRQNAWANLDEIKDAHELMLIIFDIMHSTNEKHYLRDLLKDITVIELRLQLLWGFKRDPLYHKFWNYPKCTCPKYDNIDSYPYMAFYSKRCVLHGT